MNDAHGSRDSSFARLYELLPWHRRQRFAAAVRLCVAVDIAQFSRFSSAEAKRAQQRLIAVLAYARRLGGIRDEHVYFQCAGDSQFAILPPGLDGSIVIPQLEEGLWIALRDINRELSDHARIRIRVSLYQGHVGPGDNGWVGHATTAVHRLLDSPPARETLRAVPEADFVLIVGADIYRDYILNRQGRLGPEDFKQVDVDLPEKDFHEQAWVYAPVR